MNPIPSKPVTVLENPPAPSTLAVPGHDTQIALARARTERAETRTEQAEARTEQAEARTEQAETRTEQAKTRTEQAENRTEQAETRMEEAETRTEQAETRSEKSIHASESGYRRLFETAKDGILILDVNSGRINDVNPFLVKLLSFDRSEILGKTVGELNPFKDIEANQIMLERLQKDGYVRYDDLPLEIKDGRKIAVEFVSNVYQSGDKKVIQCNVRDITERKRTERKLIRLAAMIESSEDAIIGKDLDGIITSWNTGAEKIFGYIASEIVGTSIMRLIPADRHDEETQILAKLKRGETVDHFETRRQTRDGRLIDMSVTVSTIKDPSGKVIGLSKVARDITARKHAEEEIRGLNETLEQRVAERTAQLESVNEELGAFSHSVSHDLRAPLRQVSGFVRILEEDAAASLSEENLGHLKTISHSADRMAKLIDDLLAFARLGSATLKKTSVDLGELVQEALLDFQKETKARNIAWQIAPLPVVRADPALLRMVFVNLISNAVKFTGNRAEAKIEIGCAPGSNLETVIFIRDNGAGFDPRYADKLFGTFQRLHSAADFEGSGIGLANVQRIVHRHGGRIWAEGVVDAGATFFFSIPAQNEVPPTVNSLAMTEAQRPDQKIATEFLSKSNRFEIKSPLHILHLEDEPGDAALVQSALKADGLVCDTICVKNRGDFVAALQRGGIDLILSDFSLPVFDGLSAAEIVRAQWPAIPFILVSGTLGEELAIEALKRGATDYVLKERLARLAPAIRRAMQEVQERAERRRLEAQFIEAQKMEVLGQLAGGVAHDFNNILAVIMGYSDLLRAELGPDSPLGKFADEIRLASQRAAGLTGQLLVFSRKQTVQPVVLDLNDVVNDLDKMLRRLIDENIEMTIVPGISIGGLKADPGYLGQVLMNLVVNARDAMPRGGKLTIATSNITLDAACAPTHSGTIPSPAASSAAKAGLPSEASAKEYVMLSVTDTGMGMTDEVRAHLFEPFFTTKAKGKGTGLGLATCQTIVQQCGGHIGVCSEIGKGTTFKIYFPRVEWPLEIGTKPILSGPLPRGTETLLVVEDEPSVRHLASGVLKTQGYEVLSASNGQDALHVAQGHKGAPIRLVVTDVIMPVMGGKVMSEWLKTTYPDLKILFTSGYTDDAISRHGVLEEGVEFLAKPYTTATLTRKVRDMLDTDSAPLQPPLPRHESDDFKFTF